jgi:2-polyprenyl-6-methoxyphenol hydroxylase-like FAD-dependent oxidoreductase
MLIDNKTIAIVGGGPGGLTLARLLQMKGANVIVYERDKDRYTRLQGGALDLHDESGLAALKTAGLLDEFKNNYRPGADKIRIVNTQATIMFDDHEIDNTADFGHEHFRPEIDRGPLRDILLGSLLPGTVVYDSHVIALEPVGDRWEIQFENGEWAIADIVIGADGANSKVRAKVTPIKPVWAGITMIEGVVYHPQQTAPTINTLLKGGKIFAFGNERSLIVSSKGDGSLGFATGVKTTENWIRESEIDFSKNQQLLSWFKKEFVGWAEVWQELFSSDDTLFIPRPQYCMPLDQSWATQPNITLLGDAAHWMPPYSGEGVNMAMLDALQLSEYLCGDQFSDLTSALAAYEKQMLARFAEVGAMTMASTASLHSPEALENMIAMFSQEPE